MIFRKCVRKPVPLVKLFHYYSKYDFVLEKKVMHEFLPDRFKVLPLTRYGGVNTVTMLSGGGIGPEMMEAVKTVMVAARAPVRFEEIAIDPSDDWEKCNEEFVHGLMSIRRNGVCIKGHIETQSCDPSQYSRNVALRRNLDLYANVVVHKAYPGVPTALFPDLDLVVIRQNNEGEYSMLEHHPVPGLVENMKICTQINTERTARYAFEFARANHRRKIMCMHRTNIWPHADGLFIDTARKVAAEYPDIGYEEANVRSVVRKLVTRPQDFDIIFCTNLYGSILNNMLFGLIGGPALVSSRNYGDDVAVFETGHRGRFSAMANQGTANPVAMLNAAADMLRYLGHDYHACLLSRAIRMTLDEDKVHTRDLGGCADTQDVVDNIIRRMGDVACFMKKQTVTPVVCTRKKSSTTRLPPCEEISDTPLGPCRKNSTVVPTLHAK